MNKEQQELTRLATALEGRGHLKQADTVRDLVLIKAAGFSKGYGIPDQGEGQRGKETTAAWVALQKLLWQASYYAKSVENNGKIDTNEWNLFVKATMAGDNIWEMSINPENWTGYKTGYALTSPALGKMVWWFPTSFYNNLTEWMRKNNEYAQKHLKVIMRTGELRRGPKGEMMYVRWLVPSGLTKEKAAYYALGGERDAHRIHKDFAPGKVITLGIYESNYNDQKVVDALKLWKQESVTAWQQAHGSHSHGGDEHWDKDKCLMVGYAKVGGEWLAAVETARSSGKYEPIAISDVVLDPPDKPKTSPALDAEASAKLDSLLKTAKAKMPTSGGCPPSMVPSNDGKWCLTAAEKAKDTTKAAGGSGPGASVSNPKYKTDGPKGTHWTSAQGVWHAKDATGKTLGPVMTEAQAQKALKPKSSTRSRKPRQSMSDLTGGKITKKEEGDAFRDWVNAKPERLAKARSLWTSAKSDAKGVKSSWKNSTIRAAWSSGLGAEWVADTEVKGFKHEEGGAQAKIEKELDQDTLKAYMLYPKPLAARDEYLAPYGDEFTTKTLLEAKTPDEIKKRNDNLALFTAPGSHPAIELSKRYKADTSETTSDGQPNPAGRALQWEIRKSIAAVKAATKAAEDTAKAAEEEKKSQVNSNDFFIIGENGATVRFNSDTGLPPVGTLFIRKRDGEDFYLAEFDGKATLINLRRRAGAVGLDKAGQSVMNSKEMEALLRAVPKEDEAKWKTFLSHRQEYRNELTKRRGDDDSGWFDQSRATDRKQYNDAGEALFGEEKWQHRRTGGKKPKPKGRKGQGTPIETGEGAGAHGGRLQPRQ